MSDYVMPDVDPAHPHNERDGWAVGGGAAIAIGIALSVVKLLAIAMIINAISGKGDDPSIPPIVVGVVILLITTFCAFGFFTLEPNKAAVLTFFGAYRGTIKTDGIHWTFPLYLRTKISLRVRNFDTKWASGSEGRSKVNDANGNPIEIAAVVVWRVVDTAKAVFQVESLEHFVEVQSETAVRHLARLYPYDSWDDETLATVTLIGNSDQVNDTLTAELHQRMSAAGVDVIEARITDLSYTPEIAEAMLRRQQASAIVAARRKIVEGAIGMVREAVTQLEEGTTDADAIPLDNDRKATFASNLMTVIASDHPTTPVVNVGTLSR